MITRKFSRADINLANWRNRPWSSWAFQNVNELVPSMIIRGRGNTEALRPDLGLLNDLQVGTASGETCALPVFLEQTESDALVVMRDGSFVAEWYAPHCDPGSPHIVFSISKSITGLLAGILIDRGALSVDDPVCRHVPEALGSAYGDLKVEDLLNMTVALDFEEAYLDRSGGYDRYRRAMLWNPEKSGEPVLNLREFLCTIGRADHPHGTRYAYRSPNADMAALVIEAASGQRYGDFLREALWAPMGAVGDAHITVDRAGNPRASGGISMTARDLARVGDLVRTGGNGILPATVVERLMQGGDRAVWAAGNPDSAFAGGSYRHFWYNTGNGPICGIGIHGQWLWIDPATKTVIVRMASETLPENDFQDGKVIAMLQAVSAAG